MDIKDVENTEKSKEYYREQIIETAKRINRCDILIYIYKLVVDIAGEDDNGND